MYRNNLRVEAIKTKSQFYYVGISFRLAKIKLRLWLIFMILMKIRERHIPPHFGVNVRIFRPIEISQNENGYDASHRIRSLFTPKIHSIQK